jgi:hypothetical protein
MARMKWVTTTAGIDPEKIETLNERSPVSIHKLIANGSFGPDEI